MLIQNLEITLRIVIKINVLPTSPLAIVVYLVSTTLRRILVRMLMLLGMGVLIILLVIILRQRRRLPLLLLVFKLLSYFFFLLIEQLYIVPLQCLQDALVLGINFIQCLSKASRIPQYQELTLYFRDTSIFIFSNSLYKSSILL